MEVIRYSPEHKATWNIFLETAKNGNFLFDRDFCEYHADRFTDHSLLIVKNEKVLAIFPATETDSKIISHAGLTYGGLVLHQNVNLQVVLEVFYHLLKYFYQQQFSVIIYKQIPSFYHRIASFEEDYALFLIDAKLIRRDTAFVTDLSQSLDFQQRRLRSSQKARQAGIKIIESQDFNEFWSEVLIPNLSERFKVKPVHSLAEIKLLASRFPKNIRQFNAVLNNKVVAGTTVFENQFVAHAQYISADKSGRQTGAIDLLFETLLKEIYAKYQYFSFGISNEEQGTVLNKGLAAWKEGFGAKVWTHNFYQILTENHEKLRPQFT